MKGEHNLALKSEENRYILLEKELTSAQDRNRELESRVDKLESQLRLAMSRVDEYKQENGLKQAEINNLSSQVDDYKSEIMGYAEAVNAFNLKITAIEEKNTANLYEIEMHKKQNSSLQTENSDLKSEIK